MAVAAALSAAAVAFLMASSPALTDA